MAESPWLSLGKSAAQIVAEFTPVPGLGPGVDALCTFITICQGVAANRRSTRRLCDLCHELLLAVEKYRPTPPNTLDAAFKSVNACIVSVKDRAGTWAGRSWVGGFLHQAQIQGEINQCKEDIGNCFLKFQLVSAGTTSQWQADFAIVVRSDHAEIIAYLCDIQNGQEILKEMMSFQGQTLSGKLEELMGMMQILLGEVRNTQINPQTNAQTNQYVGLAHNLYELQKSTNTLLPNLHLFSGEITDVGNRAVFRTATVDIFKGRYLQEVVVAVKVLRALDGNEKTLKRFSDEAQIWEKVWKLDQGKYILPFYGFSLGEDIDFYPFTVSPWQENGTALSYVKENDANVNYRQLIRAIANGIRVLHCLMKPSIVHGDIRAANILIDSQGNPLIADFGLSKVLEDVTETPFTQSTAAANLCRWFAPEVYTGKGMISFASDIYSFAMTVLELLTHAPPYASIKHPQEVVLVKNQRDSPPKPTDARVIERGLDKHLWTLLVECWNRIPGARPGIEEILESLEG
ncbi:hypothetical protein D9758_012005 [Tetrapyrgos nigripes]|uniref:Protein kinase domain-containing protein n=1 Tax=Tetrapyrgos nigripes TaxID=182062 RepID=A0A8H5CRY2_9AGAR|nr:hypothetical protein D9758_012005 [Tetrapyrgos nigripes]